MKVLVSKVPKMGSFISGSPSIQLFLSSVGLGCVVVAELLRPGTVQNYLAAAGFLGLFLASLLVLFGSKSDGLSEEKVLAPFAVSGSGATWSWTICGLGAAGVAIAQSWFRAGTVIAGGDITPPVGTAWIERLFSNFGWTGANLGGPMNNQVQLPWAVISWVTRELGGSGALAQRVWFSLLVAAILMGAGALARALEFSPVGGVVVAVLYFFNPMTMSQVGINDVYLLSMALLVTLPAAVISYGKSKLKLWQFCALFSLSAPFIGFLYENPPTLGMVAIFTLITPLVVWFKSGRHSAIRSIRGLICAGFLLVAVSAYWLVPSWLTLSTVATGNISGLSSWAFTESRSTLANGFWLNTTWGWAFPQYYPFAVGFRKFPLVLIRAIEPLIGFSGLVYLNVSTRLDRESQRFVSISALGALIIILFSGGTRFPGSIIFDPLYNLPYGWLLKEPGRFLVIAALGYALLGGLFVERIIGHLGKYPASANSLLSKLSPKGYFPKVAVVAIIFILAIVSGFPLLTGSVVPGPRSGFPSVHVKVPSYWTTTAGYLNSKAAPKGSLLVLPSDDFYQMPYTWYYGNDSFIVNLLRRHVVVPSSQGYEATSNELLGAIKLVTSSILSRNWTLTNRLFSAMNTPIILVRGDINSNFSGRSITSPRLLVAALQQDPRVKSIYHSGPLTVFQFLTVNRSVSTKFVTVNSNSPNLRDLSALPSGSNLVSSRPINGHISLFQVPSSGWNMNLTSLSKSISLPTGWSYSVRSQNSGQPINDGKVIQDSAKNGHSAISTVQVPFSNNLRDLGNFTASDWGPVGNCDNATPLKSNSTVFGYTVEKGVVPGGNSALVLKSNTDSACVSKTINWTGGPILLNLWVRSLGGAPPRLCIWEEPIGRCAATPPLPNNRDWTSYATAVNLSPKIKKLMVFLYADSINLKTVSVEEYGGLTIRSLSSSPHILLVGTPATNGASIRLFKFNTGYSPKWIGPKSAQHVIVDGMRNGWLVSSASTKAISPYYDTLENEILDEILLAVVAAILSWLAFWITRSRASVVWSYCRNVGVVLFKRKSNF